MVYQVTDYKTNDTKSYTNPTALRTYIYSITQNLEIANDVMEWAKTPTLGSYRFDSDTFSVMLYSSAND